MPIYQSKADLSIEDMIADVWSIYRPGFILRRRVNPLDRIDREIVRIWDNRVVGLAEVKDRHYTMAQLDGWGGYFIAASKYDNLLAVARAIGMRGLIIITTADGGVWEHRVDGQWDRREMGGRRDRPWDSAAVEMCVYLKAPRWRRLDATPKSGV